MLTTCQMLRQIAGFWYRATISFQTEVSAWILPWLELGLLLFIIHVLLTPATINFIDREIRDIEDVSFQTVFLFFITSK